MYMPNPTKTCEYCKNEHIGNYGSGRFCSSHCARAYAVKGTPGRYSVPKRWGSCGRDLRRIVSKKNARRLYQGKEISIQVNGFKVLLTTGGENHKIEKKIAKLRNQLVLLEKSIRR